MSIYDKQISDLTTADLQELIAEDAVENIRLEFKRSDVSKDEYLKKLSSFANTYGGYLVVGAEGDNTGRLVGLPGIDVISSFKQRTVQWCYDGISPPVHPFVSDAIESPQNAAKVCYVIFVDESQQAPHFLNSRKGCYVRTDEFSQRFEPCLATYEDIQHLADRRAVSVERREQMFARSEKRFGTYVDRDYEDDPHTTDEIGTTLKLGVGPRFPAVPVADENALFALLNRTRVAWCGIGFPAGPNPLSQHESAIILNPTAQFSILEVTTWGQLYYATEVESAEVGTATGNFVHLYALMGYLLVFLAHARAVFKDLGYDGTLCVRLRAEHLLGRTFWVAPIHGDSIPISRLDDVVDFTIEASSDRLCHDPATVASELIRRLFFAINWPGGAVSDDPAQRMIAHGFEYNRWRDFPDTAS